MLNLDSDWPLDRLKVSVIIPVLNGGENFRRCLESLERSTCKPAEIIVVADGDTDRSWQVAESFGAKVYRYTSSGGPARARNCGAQLADGDILFFLDADVTVYPDTVQRIQKAFAASKDLAALIGSYDSQPGATNFLSQYKNLFHHYTHQVSSETASTFWGACGAIRSFIFDELGGFDERYQKPCVEDIELGYRLKKSGYSISLCKDIQVKHLKEWRPVSLIKAEIFYRALPWTELILHDRQFKADLNLNYANQLSVILAFILVSSAISGFPIHWLWLVSLAAILGLLGINYDIYRFFYTHRGLQFTLQVIPWHWFYYLYGGATFAYGAAKHFFYSHNGFPKHCSSNSLDRKGIW